jgi:hypothetical protein
LVGVCKGRGVLVAGAIIARAKGAVARDEVGLLVGGGSVAVAGGVGKATAPELGGISVPPVSRPLQAAKSKQTILVKANPGRMQTPLCDGDDPIILDSLSSHNQ